MIKFVWNHKFKLLSIIILSFIFSIFTLQNPKIFYDSDRILQYANDIELEKNKNIDSSNLFLVGVEFNKNIQFEDVIKLQSLHNELLENKNIKLSQSVFNDISLLDINFLAPFGSNKKIENKEDFDDFIKKIKKRESLFVSKDQKKIFYIILLKYE